MAKSGSFEKRRKRENEGSEGEGKEEDGEEEAVNERAIELGFLDTKYKVQSIKAKHGRGACSLEAKRYREIAAQKSTFLFKIFLPPAFFFCTLLFVSAH